MASLTPTISPNVERRSPTTLSVLASPEDAFRHIWSAALHRYEESMVGDSSQQWQSLQQRMDRCREADDVCLVLDETMQAFERFRARSSTWGRLRNVYLKPAIEVLLAINDVIAETASSFPNVPGGKAVFVGFGILLQATRGVSAYCEALMSLFEELNFFLESLRPRLHTPSSLGPASTTMAIMILTLLYNIIVHTARLLSKRPWLGRLALYRTALLKDTRIHDALQRLRILTTLDTRAMTSEIRADTSLTREFAIQTREIALETQEIMTHVEAENTKSNRQLLADLHGLNKAETRAAASRGMIGRGVKRLMRGQKDLMAFLRTEKEEREKIDASRVFEKLGRIERADVNAQNPEGCMKGTRIKVLKDLRAWSHERHAPRIYWLNGMAGTGKSAIARSFCHVLRQDNLLGGSFFCSRGGSLEEGEVQRIIPTLAASMASYTAVFNKSLLVELTQEPFSATWNLAVQIERLLRIPLLAVKEGSPMLVLVVDALDECFDKGATRDLLSRLVRVSHTLPVKFFLTSRPEPHIRRELEALDSSLAQAMRLHDIDQDIVAGDISLYLAHNLHAMREPFFPVNWPQKADISTLTRLSGKLFIYAFTALQYLQKDPIGRLPRLTGARVTAGPFLTQLDTIYSLILSEAMDPNEYDADEIALIRRILDAILTVREPMTVESLGGLLGMPAAHLRTSLNRLYAVIYVPIRDDSGILSTFHASFSEFLTTSGRAPPHMYKDIADRHALLASVCLRRLQSDELHFNMSRAASSYLPNPEQTAKYNDDSLRYTCLNWSHHAVAAATRTCNISELVDQFAFFVGPKFIFWLEALSAMGVAEKATEILLAAQRVASYQTFGPIANFIKAALDFTERFSPAIIRSAPHTYLSALALNGRESAIGRICCPTFPYLPSLTLEVARVQDYTPLFATYSPDGSSIIVGTESSIGIYREHRRDSGVFANFGPFNGRNIAISEGGTRVVCVFDDGLRSYDLSLEASLLSERPPLQGSYHEIVHCVAFSSQGDIVASGLNYNRLRVWDAKNGNLKWISDRGPRVDEKICSVAFSPDGTLVASGTSTGMILLWVVGSGISAAKPFQAHKDCVSCIAIFPDNTRAVSGSDDRTMCLWDIACGQLIARVNAHTDAITSLALSPDWTQVVTGSLDRTMRVWDTKIGASKMGLLRRIDVLQPVGSIAFSPTGTQVVCTTKFGAVQIWEIDAKCREGRVERRRVQSELRLDNDGWLRGPKGELRLWISIEHINQPLTHPECSIVLYGPRMDIHWTSHAEGAGWTQCYADFAEKKS